MSLVDGEAVPLREKVWTSLMSVAPLRAYTRAVRRISGLPVPRVLRPGLWGALGTRIGMDLSEAELDLSDYKSFSELFVRRLRPESRVIDSPANVLISPVDGCVSLAGVAEAGRLIQAKGLDYSLFDLLGDRQLAQQLEGGSFVTIYLRPRDYHRIHAPCAARLETLRRWPGTVFPVQPSSVRAIKGLFVRNERVVLQFRCGAGAMAAVFVGAAAVAAISTPFEDASASACHFSPAVDVQRGDEIGAFHLGSTVILICQSGCATLDALEPGQEIRLGNRIGVLGPSRRDQGSVSTDEEQGGRL